MPIFSRLISQMKLVIDANKMSTSLISINFSSKNLNRPTNGIMRLIINLSYSFEQLYLILLEQCPTSKHKFPVLYPCHFYLMTLIVFQALPDDAQPYWQDQFELSASVCSHAYWRGNCKRTSVGLPCEVGVRCRTYHILGGSVLGCWTKVEAVLASLPGGHASRMQIIRIRTDEGERIVGMYPAFFSTHPIPPKSK